MTRMADKGWKKLKRDLERRHFDITMRETLPKASEQFAALERRVAKLEKRVSTVEAQVTPKYAELMAEANQILAKLDQLQREVSDVSQGGKA